MTKILPNLTTFGPLIFVRLCISLILTNLVLYLHVCCLTCVQYLFKNTSLICLIAWNYNYINIGHYGPSVTKNPQILQ